jgi:hypothetical protein
MMMSVEQSLEWLAGETEVLGKNRPSATKSNTNPTRPESSSNLGHQGGKTATNCLSYGTFNSIPNTLSISPLSFKYN